MKLSAIFLVVSTFLITSTLYAQTDAGIKSLINKSDEIALPTSIDDISKKIKVKGRVSKEGTEYLFCSWKTATNLSINTEYKTADYITYLILRAEENEVLSGLPYGLTLNGSTLEQCQAIFKADSPKVIALNETEATKNYSMLKTKKGNQYISLTFDEKSLLTMIQISTYDLDAVN